jgi:hypothetical protein
MMPNWQWQNNYRKVRNLILLQKYNKKIFIKEKILSPDLADDCILCMKHEKDFLSLPLPTPLQKGGELLTPLQNPAFS